MKDFGTPAYDGDCFTLVAMLSGRNCKDKKDFVALVLSRSLPQVPAFFPNALSSPAEPEWWNA